MAVHIKDEQELDKKLSYFTPTNFHVVSDFDKTLTKAFVDGHKVVSTYATIRDGDYYDSSYNSKARSLFEKYHPYEISNTLPLEEKKQKMEEWWSEHWNLMKDSGIKKSVLTDVVAKNVLHLREGCLDFMEVLGKQSIPLLIFSAGLGNLIQMTLEKHSCMYPSSHIVSNFFEFNTDGSIKGIPTHFIHTFNKNEYQIKKTTYYKDLKGHDNVILLGDSLGDLGMTAGIAHDQNIKIGFLNYNEDELLETELLETYKKEFDVVITEDDSMGYVNNIIHAILTSSPR